MKLFFSVAAALAASLILSGAALAKRYPHSTTKRHAHGTTKRHIHGQRTRRPHSTSLSLYERTANPSVLARQGCAAARRGEQGVVVLDFGKPSYGHRTYGTIDFSNRFISNHQITVGMLGWARGYVHCLPRHSTASIRLARGTSNYHPSVPSTLIAGKRWAGGVLALERKLRRQGLSAHVKSAGADDAEPAWDRGFRKTLRFIHGYRTFSHGRTLYNYGSLDGGVGSIWSARQVMYVMGGKGHTAALPEIYYPSQAKQWAQLAYIAHRWFHRRVHFAGVMTQGSPSCGCGYRPHAAHRALVRELAKVDTGRRTWVPRVGTTIVTGS